MPDNQPKNVTAKIDPWEPEGEGTVDETPKDKGRESWKCQTRESKSRRKVSCGPIVKDIHSKTSHES